VNGKATFGEARRSIVKRTILQSIPTSSGKSHLLCSSIMNLTSRSTRNQIGNCRPILVTVHLHRILQLDIFAFSPSTLTPTRLVDGGTQDMMPFVPALWSRSTWNQLGNCTPIFVTVRLYRILQLDVFVFCPFTHTPICLVEK
jgi:hypothetical protein